MRRFYVFLTLSSREAAYRRAILSGLHVCVGIPEESVPTEEGGAATYEPPNPPYHGSFFNSPLKVGLPERESATLLAP